jgi:hypothetical protein
MNDDDDSESDGDWKLELEFLWPRRLSEWENERNNSQSQTPPLAQELDSYSVVPVEIGINTILGIFTKYGP